MSAYHTDNGVFKSKQFMEALGVDKQKITFCGVDAHFQNGVAENSVKMVVQKARTMMLHAALRWPGYSEQELWPMALSHAVHLHNHTPSMKNQLAPVEVFTQT